MKGNVYSKNIFFQFIYILVFLFCFNIYIIFFKRWEFFIPLWVSTLNTLSFLYTTQRHFNSSWSVKVLVAQSCLTLHDPMDCSLPSSSIHGIFQERILEWVAISFSRGSSQPKDQTHISCISCFGRWILYQLSHQGSPQVKNQPAVQETWDWSLG